MIFSIVSCVAFSMYLRKTKQSYLLYSFLFYLVLPERVLPKRAPDNKPHRHFCHDPEAILQSCRMYCVIIQYLVLLCIAVSVVSMGSNSTGGPKKFQVGGPGHRSLYLSHAKQALYHLSQIPLWSVSTVQARIPATVIVDFCKVP